MRCSLTARSTAPRANCPRQCFISAPTGACSTAHRSTGQLLDNFHPYLVEQNGSDCRQAPAGNRCHLVLLDKDESCPTADLSNIGRPSGPAYSTGELLNTPLVAVAATSATASTQCSSDILCHIGDDYR